MRVLLVDPEDSPRRGHWTHQKWDLVVDTGNSSSDTLERWREHFHSPCICLSAFRLGAEDLATVRGIMQAGNGRLIDNQGVDWWKLTNILIHHQLESLLLVKRLMTSLSHVSELYCTRLSWLTKAISLMLDRELHTFNGGLAVRATARLGHYAGVVRKLKFPQLREIFLDKYDPRYRLRSRLNTVRTASKGRAVLVPSAYTNVSRMAVEYARMLPDQEFLLVATRRGGTLFDSAPNVRVVPLSAYASPNLRLSENASILNKWDKLKCELQQIPELKLLTRLGIVDNFASWFRNGFAVRDAWTGVLDREQIQSVLCGDDSNTVTRLPVLLARRRGLPTVDFHHGALDGRFQIKDLPSDVYLAKSEMEQDYLLRVCHLDSERVVLGGPGRVVRTFAATPSPVPKSAIVFFSESFETLGQRTEDIYRELLPPLAALAEQTGRQLLLKLHPFESANHRRRLLNQLLGDKSQDVEVVEGPTTADLLSRAWIGLTVQSTAVIDCALHGVTCFLCEWLESGNFNYIQQFARFQVGINLSSASEIGQIPQLLDSTPLSNLASDRYWISIQPEQLQQLLGGKPQSGLRNPAACENDARLNVAAADKQGTASHGKP